MVKSGKIYSPSEYLEKVTDRYYILESDTINEMIEEIHSILDYKGFIAFENYSMQDIDTIVLGDTDVVLVDITGEDSDGEWKTIFRWFEVPEDFKE